jgi:hypothetical protein
MEKVRGLQNLAYQLGLEEGMLLDIRDSVTRFFQQSLTKFCSNGSFQKRSILPPQRKFLPSRGGGAKKIVSDNSKCIRTSERV